MLIATKPRIILDPYQWMPSYGENAIRYSFSDLTLSLILVFDTDIGVKEKEIIFYGVRWLKHSSFPTPELVKINYIDDKDVMASGCLVEFLDSDAGQLFNKHYKKIFNLKHFVWIFLSENIRFEIICEEFKVLN